MAESHAKLSLRDTVTQEDVLVVINISEKYIRHLFLTDSYSSPREPKFTSVSDVEAYQAELDKWFKLFTQKILHT